MENLERATAWSPEHNRYCFSRTIKLGENHASGVSLVGCLENVKSYKYTLDECQIGEEVFDWHIFSIPEVLRSKNPSETANLNENEIMIATYCTGTEVHITMVLSDDRKTSMETVRKFLFAMKRPVIIH